MFKSLSHFEFIFVPGVRGCTNFSDLHTAIQLSQHHLLKRLSFSHCIFLSLLSKINWLLVCGFISGLSILFCWHVYLFLCQYHTVLINVAFRYCLKSGRVISSAFFFFLRVVLAILDLLWFHVNFRIICSSSMKNVLGNLIGITLNLWIALGSMGILTVLTLPIYEHGISFHLFVPSLISFISFL